MTFKILDGNVFLAQTWQQYSFFGSLLWRVDEVVQGLPAVALRVVLAMDGLFAFYPLALNLQLQLVALDVLVGQLLHLLKGLIKAELSEPLVGALILELTGGLAWLGWFMLNRSVVGADINRLPVDAAYLRVPQVNADVAVAGFLRLLPKVDAVFHLFALLISLPLVPISVVALVADDFVKDVPVFPLKLDLALAVLRATRGRLHLLLSDMLYHFWRLFVGLDAVNVDRLLNLLV